MASSQLVNGINYSCGFRSLWAIPIYDANRCSVGFHPLHQLFPIGIYLLFSLGPYFLQDFYPSAKLYLKLLQYIGFGLLIHMALDSIDCQLNIGAWFYST
ncbi:MAG: hypothetical protein ACJAWS_002960 [Oleiphilaceae bacterium]